MAVLPCCPDGRNIKLEWILTDERREKERVMDKVGANLHISYRGFYQLLRSNPSGLILVLKYDHNILTKDFNSHSTSNAENMTRDVH